MSEVDEGNLSKGRTGTEEGRRSSLSEDERAISRRAYLAAAGGVVAAAVIGGAAYYLSQPTPTTTPTTTPTQPPLRYAGASWVMYPEIAKEWEKLTGQKLEYTIIPIDVIAPRIVASGGAGWDITHNSLQSLEPITSAVPPVIQPIPIEKIPRWTETKPEEMCKFFVDPEAILTPRGFTEDAIKHLMSILWYERDKKLNGVPAAMNTDTIGYLPEFIPYEEKGDSAFGPSYNEVFNPEWKGHVALETAPGDFLSKLCAYLAYNKLADLPSFDGTIRALSKEDVDTTINFLAPYVQSGHIKAFWVDYGEAVTYFATKEVWIQFCWQPVVMDTRRAGVPCYYARPIEGTLFWWSQDMISIQTDKLESCYKFLNWRLSPWYGKFISRNGYSIPNYGMPDIKEYMGIEFWNWYWGGKATYKPIDEAMKEMWPDREDFWTLPERLQQALFLPDKYTWNPGEGTPHPRGNLRDQGSLDDRMEQIGCVATYPKNIDYIVERWSYLRSLLP